MTESRVLAIQADVMSEEDCKRAIEQTVEAFGGIDILVNNAGTSAAKPFEQVETEVWRQDLELKLFGAIHCSRYAIPYMRASRRRLHCESYDVCCQNTAGFLLAHECQPRSGS